MGPQTQQSSTEFRGAAGGAEAQSGLVLLVEAYAAIWLLVFLFILWTLQRQRRMGRRMAELEGQLERARAVQDEDPPSRD
ncbi:MAG: CcmD family protein [Deltaproteobacteria bacterium]|jgi:CcmD family protein|nr:CcmD family protein [Deltaproteobacteria bacterium]MBW2531664.1 CcmD family protein [Deltaproteobacteria bacterium]